MRVSFADVRLAHYYVRGLYFIDDSRSVDRNVDDFVWLVIKVLGLYDEIIFIIFRSSRVRFY